VPKHFKFEPKREKITKGWEKLQKVELHGLYLSLLKSSYIKETEMDEERGTHGGQEISTQDFDGETCREETTWETWHRWEINRLLKLVLKKEDVGLKLDPRGSRWQVVGFCEQGNELSGSIKHGNFVNG